MKNHKDKDTKEVLDILKERFFSNMNRHEGIQWEDVRTRLDAHPDKLRSLSEMERTGGEPDLVGYDAARDQYLFYDCSAQSPSGRRSICYDRQGQEDRKSHAPETNALDLAAAMVSHSLKHGFKVMKVLK